MTVLLIVLGVLGAYLGIGALYARSQVFKCHARASADWTISETIRESTAMQLCWRVFAWPYAIVFDAVRDVVGGWFMAPLNRQRERIEQLRRDARAWDVKRRNGTDAEREMATEVARMCREQADELERSL